MIDCDLEVEAEVNHFLPIVPLLTMKQKQKANVVSQHPLQLHVARSLSFERRDRSRSSAHDVPGVS